MLKNRPHKHARKLYSPSITKISNEILKIEYILIIAIHIVL